MEEIISFIRENNFKDLRSIALYKTNQHSTFKDNIRIEIDFYGHGGLRYIKFSSNNEDIMFGNHSEYDAFLFDKEVFKSKGKSLLEKYVVQNAISNIQEFIEQYFKNRKVFLYFSKKIEFMIQLSFGKDFSISEVSFLDGVGKEYTKLSSEEFYNSLDDLKINK